MKRRQTLTISEAAQLASDATEARLRGLVIVYVYGVRELPPRLRGVWRFTARPGDIFTADRLAVGRWISEHCADEIGRVIDWAAVGPDSVLDWSMREAVQVYVDGLPYAA